MPRPTSQTPQPQDQLTAALAAVIEPIVRRAVEDAIGELTPPEPRPALLTIDQLCEELQISRASLHRLRSLGLPCCMLLDSPRFDLAAVLAWLARSRERFPVAAE